MSSCDIDDDSLIVAYVDGELDREAAAKVERLITRDPQAARKRAMFRTTAALLRAACREDVYDNAPIAAASRRFDPRLRQAAALAASLAAVIVGFCGGNAWSTHAPSEQSALLDEVASYHQIFSREGRHLVEVPADQVDHLTAWLGKRLERRIEIPDLAAAGLRFAGGRMEVFKDRPVAELMYTREIGLPIGICITRIEDDQAPVSVKQRGTQRLASWIASGYAFVVVGEIDDSQARDLAERVAAQTKS